MYIKRNSNVHKSISIKQLLNNKKRPVTYGPFAFTKPKTRLQWKQFFWCCKAIRKVSRIPTG